MKTKLDFITNSSSTNFYFIFKGDHIDLYQRLLEHKEEFELSYDTYEDLVIDITTWDIIRELDKSIRSGDKDLWLLKKIVTLDSAIDDTEEELNAVSETISSYKGGEITDRFYIDRLKILNKRRSMLQKAKEREMSSYIMIAFGDNHGDIKGDPIGTTMDYSGRYIFIDSENFIVFTEQSR